MRDFQADVIHAALAGKPVPASEFSWSAARHRLFTECRRAYFIRYYLAQGGWNEHAHPLARTAYLEKHIPAFGVWLADALERSVAAALTGLRPGGSARTREFAMNLPRAVGREVAALSLSLQRKAYLADPKLPAVREHFRWQEGFRTADEVAAKAVPALTRACDFLIRSDFAAALAETEMPEYDVSRPFLQIRRGAFNVWLKGGILRNAGRTTSLLRFLWNPEERPGNGIESALFSAYVKSWNPAREAVLTSFAFSAENAGFASAPPPVSMESLTDLIDGSAAGMLAVIAPDGTVRAADFPETAERERCPLCPFSGSCAMLRKYAESSH